jgi:type IV pilus assembly protein PilC
MKKFKYKARDAKGALVTGEVEAKTKQLAAKLVRAKGLFVISLNPTRDSPFDLIGKLKNRVTPSDVTNFTRQLATMINSGLPLTEALLILRSQTKSSMQKITSQILADVEEGEALSSALSKYPNVFSKTFIALIKSGEVGGVMDEVLVRLADDLEKEQEFKGKVKGALIYPAIVVVGMVIVALVMVIFVIPRLTTLYEQFNATLPISTRILIGTSKFMISYWPFVIAFVAGGIYVFRLYRATEAGRKNLDNLIFKLPIIGDLEKQVILTDLTRTLSLMISSGVSILEGLSISAEVVSNKIISEALIDAAKMVEKGFPVAFAFAKHPEAFPFILSQMVAVGEETGNMDEVLKKVSHVFEVESDQKLKALTASVEPIILLVLGVGVAMLVVSIILPIYNLTTQL